MNFLCVYNGTEDKIDKFLKHIQKSISNMGKRMEGTPKLMSLDYQDERRACYYFITKDYSPAAVINKLSKELKGITFTLIAYDGKLEFMEFMVFTGGKLLVNFAGFSDEDEFSYICRFIQTTDPCYTLTKADMEVIR